MLGRRKGLSFTRRRKRIETSAIQAGLFLGGRMYSGICHWMRSCFLFYVQTDLCRPGHGAVPSTVVIVCWSIGSAYAIGPSPKRGDVIVFKPEWQQRMRITTCAG